MESITIKFTANGQTLTGGGLYCASNTVRYIIAEFDLGDNWQGYDSVRAVWSNDFKCISTVLDPGGSCTVPHEVLERRGKVTVNLVGSILEDDELTDRLTTYPVLAITVDANAKICGTETAEVTPSQFEQYVAIVIAEVEKVTGMTAVAHALPEGSAPTANYSGGVLTLGIPKGDTGATGNGISSVEFNEDYSLTFYFTDSEPFTTPSIRGAQGARGYGIASVEKIGSAGLVDTYRINFEDPSVPPTTFTVTNGEEGPQGPRGYTGETGNGIDRIELTDTTGAVKTYTIYFTDGSTYDFEVTDGEVTDAVLDEATIVQTNSDNVPYLFRNSGGDVRTGRKEFDTIVGGTVGWNQLLPTLDTFRTEGGVTMTYADGVATISSTVARNGIYVPFKYVKDHKYLMLCDMKSENNIDAILGVTSAAYVNKTVVGNNAWQLISGISNSGTTISGKLYIYAATAFSNLQAKNYMSVDLTAYFGSATIADYVYTLEQGTAGAGVAWLKENAPQLFKYNAYDAGSLVSVSGLTSHDMVGFNQWDEEWEVGGISDSTGEPISSQAVRTKNYNKCLPNTVYYGEYGGSGSLVIDWYDYDKAFILAETITNTTRTSPINAYYFKLRTTTNYGTTYKNDICINLSDASLNGTYKPYTKHSYPLDSTLTLRGIPKLDANNKLYYDGDIYPPSGNGTERFAEVDFGTLNWTYSSADGWFQVGHSDHRSRNAICSKYPVVHMLTNLPDKTLAVVSGYFAVKDSAYTDAAAFKSAMSGVMLTYEKATPTAFTADPYTNPQIVDPSGTEEYVGSPIPVGHETDYPMTLTDTMPTADGTYTMSVTVQSGKRTINWS